MIFKANIFLLLLLCFAVLPATAYAQYERKDSFYFMKDDGIFDDEEKDEEAEYIKRQCEVDTFQPQYYNCACVAGAFRVKRDEPVLRPQDTILSEVLNDKEGLCVDTAAIAGNMYKTCQDFSKYFRSNETRTSNIEYCECSGNKLAELYKKRPSLKMRNINLLKTFAMDSCDQRFR